MYYIGRYILLLNYIFYIKVKFILHIYTAKPRTILLTIVLYRAPSKERFMGRRLSQVSIEWQINRGTPMVKCWLPSQIYRNIFFTIYDLK